MDILLLRKNSEKYDSTFKELKNIPQTKWDLSDLTPKQIELLGRMGFTQNDILNNEKLRDQKIKNSLKELSEYSNYHTSYQIS